MFSFISVENWNSASYDFVSGFTKSLELCVNSQNINQNNLNLWYQQIEGACLSEREEYQKKLELLLITSLFHHFPEIEIENLICESPDFIIKYKDKK